MKLQALVAPLCLLGTLSLSGCEEYFTVNEACHDKLTGGNSLDPIEEDAMLRVNCYRRLTGLARGAANELVQQAADAEVSYVQQNPDYQRLLASDGETAWLTQEFEDDGYTGNGIYDRLTGEEINGGAGYTIYDVATTGIWEFILVDVAFDPAELKSGAEAIDELMRSPVFRQSALQPSWIHGAYSEGDLPQQWFIDGRYENLVAGDGGGDGGDGGAEDTGTEPATDTPIQIPYGRVYYMVVIYQAPHFEHVDKPVLLPKEDQTGVPLYSWSENRNLIENGAYVPVQIGYPITLTMGALDPVNYEPVDQNQYNALISGASVVGENGPLETEVVHPGDDPEDVWPSGLFQRTTLAIFTRQPLAPSSKYDVFIDLQTPEGIFTVDYSFRTATEDPGLNTALGQTPAAPPAALSRMRRGPKALHTIVPAGGRP